MTAIDEDLHQCRVCGLRYDDFFPWGATGTDPTFDICDCCGTEFGYQDITVESVRAARARWLAAGGEWREERTRPSQWDRQRQLAAIPAPWR